MDHEHEPGDPGASGEPLNAATVARLVENKRRFLSFLEKRVPHDAAEEILQAAFVKSVEKADDLRNDEKAIPWFYRLLRNAVTDHYRRAAAGERALIHEVAEHAHDVAPPPELEQVLCACFEALLPTLKPEYADILRAVDLGGEDIGTVAGKAGITVNNAGVRLHRARQALRKRLESTCRTCATHACLDCTCGEKKGV